ncbi:Hint domain-containing protein [Psychromarinibacter halotolerans]|uniref:Hint domain-containing protein n=1 Tax=Psychromarinibacter halotolerans TaxID=1775175 RepID=A0ABV7GPV8_9RHOB|nr:Hint domain-containing protein [Psychromarinibacter halotolerans]MDF0597091.1 Hint domain-containing protein [Psychromarinibacter halotolerans]
MGIWVEQLDVNYTLGATIETFNDDDFDMASSEDPDYVVYLKTTQSDNTQALSFEFDFDGSSETTFILEPEPDLIITPTYVTSPFTVGVSDQESGTFLVTVLWGQDDLAGESVTLTVTSDPTQPNIDADTDTITFVLRDQEEDFVVDTVCFATGTAIGTPCGTKAVESLRPGDPILTVDGRTVPVKWVGRQSMHRLLTDPNRFSPVRVAAGALADGMPRRDLVLTKEHGLMIDGLIINAGALVNGTTVTVEPVETLRYRETYYHVETEGHDLILAEGAPAETFLDTGTRCRFDNYLEYRRLHGADTPGPERGELRISSARLVPRHIRERLAAVPA